MIIADFKNKKLNLIFFKFKEGAGPPSAENQCKTKGRFTHIVVLKRLLIHFLFIQKKNNLERDPPASPQFRITNVNVHSATIAWSTVPGTEEVSGYQIFIRGTDWETHEMVKSVLNSTMPTNHTISSLKCGSKYQIYLIAFNEAGNSEPSGVQTFQTLGNGKLLLLIYITKSY